VTNRRLKDLEKSFGKFKDILFEPEVNTILELFAEIYRLRSEIKKLKMEKK